MFPPGQYQLRFLAFDRLRQSSAQTEIITITITASDVPCQLESLTKSPNMMASYSYLIGTGGLTTEAYTMVQTPGCGYDLHCEMYVPVGFTHQEASNTITVTDKALPGQYLLSPYCTATFFSVKENKEIQISGEVSISILVVPPNDCFATGTTVTATPQH